MQAPRLSRHCAARTRAAVALATPEKAAGHSQVASPQSSQPVRHRRTLPHLPASPPRLHASHGPATSTLRERVARGLAHSYPMQTIKRIRRPMAKLLLALGVLAIVALARPVTANPKPRPSPSRLIAPRSRMQQGHLLQHPFPLRRRTLRQVSPPS